MKNAVFAVIGPIIPPSLPVVVYAMTANESVGRLFFGGVIPGLIIGATLFGFILTIENISSVISSGINAVHFGVIVVLNSMIGWSITGNRVRFRDSILWKTGERNLAVHHR